MRRSTYRSLPCLATLALALGGPLALFPCSRAAAAEFRHGREVVIPADAVIDDDLYLAGGRIEILGRVTGSVFAAGRTVTVSGYVGGDVNAAAREVRCTGHVAGSVHAAGERVALDGMVARDALAAGREVTLAGGGRVGRDLAIAAGSVLLHAPVGRHAWLDVGEATLSDSLGGSLRADARDLRLESSAVVAGDLATTSHGTLTRAPGSRVLGRVSVLPAPERERRRDPAARAVGWVRGLIGMLALGALVLLPWRGFSAAALGVLARRPGPSLGVGALVLLLLPAAALVTLIAGLLVGGWWIALFLAALFALALLAGYALAAARLGAALLARSGARGAHLVWALLAGLAVLGALVKVPYVGPLVGCLAMLFGMGALALAGWPRRAATGAVTATPDPSIPGGAA